ncbi:MAG TPA: nitric oxide synthase oxygenase [Pseudonocardia sp.]
MHRTPRCPVPAVAQRTVNLADATAFLEQLHAEDLPPTPLRRRLQQVKAEIEQTGTYVHTEAELAFGARVAWRNAARCIGRLYWNGLRVRDRRNVTAAPDVAAECAAHLRESTRGGRIRSTITIFAPDGPDGPGPRILNDQLIRYAGHRRPNGAIRGDGAQVAFTERAIALGWRPPEPLGRFDVLPMLISSGGGEPQLFELPPDAVSEVPLSHPEFAWFAELRLRWHAVPAISNMPLEIGGVTYPAAPFNGWYVGTEIGARNLADTDRYDLLPVVGERMGLDMRSERTLWRDRAIVELVRAVQHSFDVAGVTMSDHHTESARFLKHVSREQRAGRRCPADWSWIVPPVSGSLTPVYHRYYDEPDPATRPAYLPPQPR